MVEVRFHSLGGQGAVTLINMLAQAGDLVGHRVQAFPFFGAERRGAPVRAYVRMDDKEIYLRSEISRPDYLVIMSPSLIEAGLPEGTKEDTVVLVNMTEQDGKEHLSDLPFEVNVVDATSIAIELGMEVEGMPVVNIVFLGAVSYLTELVSLEAVTDVIRESVPPRRLDSSMEAARRGFTSVVKIKEVKAKSEKSKKSAAS
jgi:2-oxoacid:acceptor oxidoreductase gamma subunit (pyruvate/2-ketoisovalerate family)